MVIDSRSDAIIGCRNWGLEASVLYTNVVALALKGTGVKKSNFIN